MHCPGKIYKKDIAPSGIGSHSGESKKRQLFLAFEPRSMEVLRASLQEASILMSETLDALFHKKRDESPSSLTGLDEESLEMRLSDSVFIYYPGIQRQEHTYPYEKPL